jgi:uncharacterized protein YrzB (UPF0473 family)
VDAMAVRYAKQYKAHEGDIKAIAKKLKSEWKGVEKSANKKVDRVVKSLKPSKK